MDTAVAQTLFLAACLSCFLFFLIRRTMHQQDKLPPGPIPLPLIGNLLQMDPKEIGKTFMKMSEKHGPVFRLYFGSEKVVILNGYETVKEALINQAEVFSERGKMPSFDQIFHGFGINCSNGENWKQMRLYAIMTLKNFGMGKRSIEERIQEEAQFLMEKLRTTKGLPFDPTFFLYQATSNVICSIVFGNRFEYDDNDFLHLLEHLNDSIHLISSIWGQLFDMFTSIMKYLPGPHNRILYCLKSIEEFVLKKVKHNQETLDSNNPRDFIDSFLIKMEQEKQNSSSYFHLKNLVATVLSLFLAGTETTSTTLRYGFLILLKYPEIEEKLHEEIDRVLGPENSPRLEDRTKMPYTNAVIHEIQRFCDLLPLNLPHVVTQDIQFHGYTIHKGTKVIPSLHSVLWDPKEFSNPESFNPGHFLDENGCFKKNDAFMAFSAGKRVCLGESLGRTELFVFFVSILQNFTLKSDIQPNDIDISPEFSNFISIPQAYKLSVVPR
ncbi:cytochrome P450 2A13 [Microcaecilia unicolor]|uniref:Cytochrome P450 2A13-like n=1 Tax=Microcaecilia unicolor TaxID=1415580 RepID=A0A6P7Z6U6_9AMPH|nr:cytochrome P450 2A13-like [Microcaecilia unicolor]